jgi:hypothetical protein
MRKRCAVGNLNLLQTFAGLESFCSCFSMFFLDSIESCVVLNYFTW